MTTPMISWHATLEDHDVIRKIVQRAEREYPGAFDRLTLTMDLTATHANGCPLKLTEMLEGPLLDFGHDLGGISRHIDRRTGQLGGCFLPRFAQPR